eukprot:3295382-Rhodomonas_salina.1
MTDTRIRTRPGSTAAARTARPVRLVSMENSTKTRRMWTAEGPSARRVLLAATDSKTRMKPGSTVEEPTAPRARAPRHALMENRTRGRTEWIVEACTARDALRAATES